MPATEFGDLASLVTIYDPEQLVVYLPKAFEDVVRREDSSRAGFRYWVTANEVVQNRSYPGAAALEVRPFFVSDEDLRVLDAESAGLRVIDSFVKHGKGRCKCYVSPPVERTEVVGDDVW